MKAENFISIGDAPLEIIDGDRGVNYPKQSDFFDAGYCLFLNAGNVTSDGFRFDNCQFVDAQKDSALRNGKLKRNDIVMTTRGTLGNVSYFSDSVPHEQMRINSGMVIFRCDELKITAPYFYYVLKSQTVVGQIEALRSGAAQPQLPIRDIKKINFPMPSLLEQQTVVETIAPYDNLIANNKRRIELLEQSARLLFKEWFVHLRYPGHVHAMIVDGVPKGWKLDRLSSIAMTNSTSYAGKNLPQTITYIDISSVEKGRITRRTEFVSTEAPGRARRRAVDGDTIWSNVRPNLKQYALVLDPLETDVFSTGFTVLTPKSVPWSFLYLCATTDNFIDNLVNLATGVSYPAVRPDDFERAEVIVPVEGLLASFHELCEPIFRQCYKLNKYAERLASARDLLLPRLMDGRIEV